MISKYMYLFMCLQPGWLLLLLETLLPHCFHRMWWWDVGELLDDACVTDEGGGGGFHLKAAATGRVWAGKSRSGGAEVKMHDQVWSLRVSLRKQIRSENRNRRWSRSHRLASCVINMWPNIQLQVKLKNQTAAQHASNTAGNIKLVVMITSVSVLGVFKYLIRIE